MAKPTIEIVIALRATADRLQKTGSYQWGHMGSCNCGFLAQQITSLSKSDIHKRALQRPGDWNEQLNDYCPASGLKIDALISDLIASGFSIEDLKHLERLSDPAVLRMLPGEKKALRHNVKTDVIQYLRCWARWVEEKLLENIHLQSLTSGSQLVRTRRISFDGHAHCVFTPQAEDRVTYNLSVADPG
jgi:hypothetical protein